MVFSIIANVVNAIAGAFKWVFNTVLTPLLQFIIVNVAKPVLEEVLKAIQEILRPLFLAVLQLALALLDIIEQAFDIFSGTAKIYVTESASKTVKEDYLINVIFGQNAVSSAFWYITLIAFILTMAFTVVSVTRSTMDLSGKRPIGKILGSTGKAMLSFLMVPFVVICSINLASIVLEKSSEAIMLSSGASSNATIGTHLFLTLSSEAYTSKYNTDALKKKLNDDFYNGRYKYTMEYDQLKEHFDPAKIKYFSGYVVCVALAVMMLIACFLFIMRIFEILILYIVSPFFVASIPLDDGGRFDSWRNLFIAKLLSGFGMVYSMKIYIMLIPLLLGTNVKFFAGTGDADMYKNTIMQLVFLVGGSYAIVKSNTLMMQAINPDAARAEADQTQTAMGGLSAAGGKIAGMGMAAMRGIGRGVGGAGRKLSDGANSLYDFQTKAWEAEASGRSLSNDDIVASLPQSWRSTQAFTSAYQNSKANKQRTDAHDSARDNAMYKRMTGHALPKPGIPIARPSAAPNAGANMPARTAGGPPRPAGSPGSPGSPGSSGIVAAASRMAAGSGSSGSSGSTGSSSAAPKVTVNIPSSKPDGDSK